MDATFSSGTMMTVREGFSYFSGVNAALTSYQTPIDQRRVFVILNGAAGSPSHPQWQILYRTSSFNAAQAADVRALIDSIQPPAADPRLDYTGWAAGLSLPPGQDEPHADAENDGLPNGVEFLLDLDPLRPDAARGWTAERGPGGAPVLRYRIAKNRRGLTLQLQAAPDLRTWEPLEPPPGSVNLVPGETHDEVSIRLDLLGLGPAAGLRLAAVSSEP